MAPWPQRPVFGHCAALSILYCNDLRVVFMLRSRSATVRCLIIDDDDSPRTLMERLVTRAGHRATGCSSPMAGIQAATMAPYDIAIVDMEMPGMDGAALIGELRRVMPEIRILVVSGYGDRNHVMAAIEAGADG